jgi:two-component system, NtrC family, response regulator HydG
MTMHSQAHSNGDPNSATLDNFHSEDAPMIRCLELARIAAQTELPILILGESGVGKTLLARAIHNSSSRAHNAFVAFNAAALSDTLLDSQLFGHERGAFTGAQKTVKGKFELAHDGTLFIDEIADMSASAQSKILRAVEYGEFERLGSDSLRRADVRLISATHLPLHQLIGTGGFRQDLFYRISGLTISLPPLRARPRDLPLLIAGEIAAASRRQKKDIKGLDAMATQRLIAYAWPGNLRELSRVIHTAVALTKTEIIAAEALLLQESFAAFTAVHAPVSSSAFIGADLGSQDTLEAAERRHIQRILEQAGGNKRRAAKVLGISRSTLDRKLAHQG